MLRADNDAWNVSRSAGIAADVSNQYPPLAAEFAVTVPQCQAFDAADLWTNQTINPSTIVPQPGWHGPPGVVAPLVGRVYVMTAVISERLGNVTQPNSTQQIHAIVTPDGRAYDFIGCKN